MKIKDYWYSLSIIFLVFLGFYFPEKFTQVGSFKLNSFIKPVLQLIMLGMGATISITDFAEIFKSPKKVLIGLVCQFTIMPVLGFSLAHLFALPPEIGAGLILIGCSPSGLASNVMALLSRANVALSITITTMATLMAPVFTPLLMKLFGGGLIEVDFLKMFWDMSQLVLIPIIIGVVLNKFLPVFVKSIKSILPVISMVGIAYIILVVTASGAASLKTVGFIIIIAVLIHNLLGYVLGYYGSKLLRMSEPDARAVALEVGMQNAGLASALANEMGRLATMGVAAAIFGPVMNITGSILSNHWSKSATDTQDNKKTQVSKTND